MDFIFSEDQFNFENLSHRLAHMNEKDIVDMVNKYYAGNSTTHLIEYYNLDVLSSQFVKLFPPLRSDDVCPYCKVNHEIKLPTKNYMYVNFQISICPNCKHENSSECTCSNCKAAMKEEKQRRELEKRSLIESYYDISNAVLISELELTSLDKIYLAALLRARLDEGMKIINPLSEYEGNLTPSDKFDFDLLENLFAKDIIVPHPSSKTKAFEDNEDFPFVVDLFEVSYRLNLDPVDKNYARMVSDLMYPNSAIIRSSTTSCLDLWRALAFSEAINYYTFKLNRLSLPVRIGEKTKAVIEHLLEDYTVSQIYNIIHRSVANSVTYGAEKKLPKTHIANLVCSKMEDYGERAKAKKWDLVKYGRHSELPESLLSKVFFQSILLAAENGIDILISENFINPSFAEKNTGEEESEIDMNE